MPGFEPRFISFSACGFATVPTELDYFGSFPSDIKKIFLGKAGDVMILKHQKGTRKMPCGMCQQAVHVSLTGFCAFHHLRDWFVWVFERVSFVVSIRAASSSLYSVLFSLFRALLHVTYISTPGVSNVPFIRSSAVFCRPSAVNM